MWWGDFYQSQGEWLLLVIGANQNTALIRYNRLLTISSDSEVKEGSRSSKSSTISSDQGTYM